MRKPVAKVYANPVEGLIQAVRFLSVVLPFRMGSIPLVAAAAETKKPRKKSTCQLEWFLVETWRLC